MRNVLICCLLASLVSCLDEQRAEPAKPATFVRYINGGNEDEARALEKTSDGGFVILANTSVTVEGVEVIRIKLVKVDQYGTVEWSRIHPGTIPAGIDGYRGNGIHVSDAGYIITGEVIHASGKSELLVLQTNAEGLSPTLSAIVLPKTLDTPGGVQVGNVHGQAVTRIDNDRLIILGSLTDRAEVMVLAELNIAVTPPTVSWDWMYSGGEASVINKVFVDGNNVIFGGTLTQIGSDSHTDVRLIQAVQNSQGTTFDLPFGDPDLSEEANGICKTSNGYALIGSTDNGQDKDILFTRLSRFGDLLSNVTFPATYPSGNLVTGVDEEGNDICATADGGFIILATITSTTVTADGQSESIGRGDEDYYLIKTNTFGEITWRRAFGSKREDVGVAVSQANDGGYVILGTTELANVSTITLIKTNAQGEIE